MRVVDAGVVVALLVGDLGPERVGEEELAAPHLLDSEVINALWCLVLHGDLSEQQGQAAIDGFLDLTLTRYPIHQLRARMWELRHDLGAYDATYLALAEQTGASSLLTMDARLARVPNPRCPIEVLQSRPADDRHLGQRAVALPGAARQTPVLADARRFGIGTQLVGSVAMMRRTSDGAP